MRPVICVLLLAIAAFKAVESNSCSCETKYKTIGCWKDKRTDRALTDLLLTERDKYSSKYNGYNIDWVNWDTYLPGFTCRCAEAALKKGYKYFGLQFWGECWGGGAVGEPYKKHGKGDSDGCYGLGYEICSYGSNNCVGKTNHNYVYEVVTFVCPLKFERIGCYKDKKKNPRPLDKYIMTDRDTRHRASSGIAIDWINFDTYLPEFACRCAQKAQGKGYDTFGVQYWGECWSGNQVAKKYYNDGVSDNCQNQCYEPCHEYNQFCTGTHHANAVYRIKQDKCKVVHKALGCYKEDKLNRAFVELMINDYYPEEVHFIGMTSNDFENETDYMESFVCKCARKSMEKGYKEFGVSANGAECWSSPSADSGDQNRVASNDCYADEATLCGGNHETCYGGNDSIFAYQINPGSNVNNTPN